MIPDPENRLCHYAQMDSGRSRADRPARDRLTLVVCTRDRPEILQRLVLPSLVQAASAGFAVIVVDQSTDTRTELLVSGVCGITYLRSSPGLSRGRNAAVAAVATELVAFTDDDVSFGPDWLDRLAAIFDAHPLAGAVCGRAVEERGELMPGSPAGTFDWPLHPFGLGSGFNMAFRVAALDEAGGFDEELGAGARYRAGEDTDMFYRVSRAGWSIVCSDTIGVMHSAWRRPAEMVRLHHSYGIGAGAQTAGHVRRGDRTAAWIALREVARHAYWFLRHVLTGDAHRALLQVSFVTGLVRGLTVRLLRGPQAPGGRDLSSNSRA